MTWISKQGGGEQRRRPARAARGWGWGRGGGGTVEGRGGGSHVSHSSTPDKVLIPERYSDLEPGTPWAEELKEKQKKVERIKTLIAKSR